MSTPAETPELTVIRDLMNALARAKRLRVRVQVRHAIIGAIDTAWLHHYARRRKTTPRR